MGKQFYDEPTKAKSGFLVKITNPLRSALPPEWQDSVVEVQEVRKIGRVTKYMFRRGGGPWLFYVYPADCERVEG